MNRQGRHRGVVSIMAMMFLVIFSSLAAAMAIVAQGNLRTAETYRRVNRSLTAAETGLAFAQYRIGLIASTIYISQGTVDENLADDLWDELVGEAIDEFSGELHSLQTPNLVNEDHLVLGEIEVGDEANAPTFQVELIRHPIAGENYDSAFYDRDPYNVGEGENRFTADGEPVSGDNPPMRVWVRMLVTGRDGGYSRNVQMDFRIDKKVRYAILSRNRIMIGRNVIVEGTIGSRYTQTEFQHGHPVQIRSNFYNLADDLDDSLLALRDYLIAHDADGDNRILLEDDEEASALVDGPSLDRNADGYVDDYDMFLNQFDTGPAGSPDGRLTMSEFQNGSGDLIDHQLWELINEVKYPAGTEFDWELLRVKEPGGSWVDATADLSVVDNHDDYAKIAGSVILAASKEAWEAGAGMGAYQQFFEDSVRPDQNDDALTFSANTDDLAEFSADNFDVTEYRDLATGDFADQVATAEANVAGDPVVFTPAGPDTIESVPFNSPHPYDYYMRPVYENFVFENITIPRGTNALFVNCKFIGVTFLDTAADNADPNYNYAGMQNPDGSIKYEAVTAQVDGSTVADTKPHGNNVRFHNCTFEGMVASEVPNEFTQARNKVQFTGVTRFDVEAPSLTADQKALFRKSTLLMPQYSVEMGTFTDPTSVAETVRLDGTIVAGVFDVRGQATIDGSLLTTYEPVSGEGALIEGGNPASYNTTIGYFESASGDGEGEIPAGGFGKIIIRYDPTRALPDGIVGPIEVAPEFDTYAEGGGA